MIARGLPWRHPMGCPLRPNVTRTLGVAVVRERLSVRFVDKHMMADETPNPQGGLWLGEEGLTGCTTTPKMPGRGGTSSDGRSPEMRTWITINTQSRRRRDQGGGSLDEHA